MWLSLFVKSKFSIFIVLYVIIGYRLIYFVFVFSIMCCGVYSSTC